ncbi:MAG: 30S ribosomal protein S9 [Myxococcota bacterium]|jgi:small subunit ribosomal protein S9|nr:30S ribosomal protein S9 [Myxococcota bacterium]
MTATATPQRWYATGKRKTSIARVYMTLGEGKVTVNGRDVSEYFSTDVARRELQEPLEVTKTAGRFDITVNTEGGGYHGQARAIRHGISRALQIYNPELRKVLKPLGFLTRDSRVKERKKYGQRGARARFQFSKR